MKITAIDFETANSFRTSACAIGMCVYDLEADTIVDTFYSLIKPYPYFVHDVNKSIHGIGIEQLELAPTFGELWPKIKGFISGKLVAHNASFDISCLIQALEHYSIDYQEFECYCTLNLSREVLTFENSGFNHTLPNVAKVLGLEEINHHNALDDAIACAKIFSRLSKTPTLKSFSSHAEKACSTSTTGIYGRNLRKDDDVCEIPFTEIDEIVFQGSKFVVTGEFNCSRKAIENFIKEKGGAMQSKPTKDTKYLVVGSGDSTAWAHGNYGRKIEIALNFKDSILFLTEANFFRLHPIVPIKKTNSRYKIVPKPGLAPGQKTDSYYVDKYYKFYTGEPKINIPYTNDVKIETKDKSFVLLGGFLECPQCIAEDLILKNGGIIKSDISKKVDFLLVGKRTEFEDRPYSKITKAQTLGIPIISESFFREQLNIPQSPLDEIINLKELIKLDEERNARWAERFAFQKEFENVTTENE